MKRLAVEIQEEMKIYLFKEVWDMTTKEYWAFVQENPIIGIADTDHSLLKVIVCKGNNGYSLVEDDSSLGEQTFYVIASEPTRKELLDWLDLPGTMTQYPGKVIERVRRILNEEEC